MIWFPGTAWRMGFWKFDMLALEQGILRHLASCFPEWHENIRFYSLFAILAGCHRALAALGR